MKYCQGPSCHEYKTKDRIRGSKGDKHYETRKRTTYYELFCDQRCMYNWVELHGQQAVDHFGRIHEPTKLTEENAWIKDYDYDWNAEDRQSNWHWLNTITDERRPITKAQYNDHSLVRP